MTSEQLARAMLKLAKREIEYSLRRTHALERIAATFELQVDRKELDGSRCINCGSRLTWGSECFACGMERPR